MSTKRFIIRTILKIVALIIICSLVFSVSNVFNTIISNELALGQMENSNATYLLMEVYNGSIKPLCATIVTISTLVILCCIGIDIYKFFKTINKGETKNENEETL